MSRGSGTRPSDVLVGRIRLTNSRFECHHNHARTHPGVLAMRTRRAFTLLVIGIALFGSSCGSGGSSNNPPPQPISIQISPSTLTATQDGAPASLNVTVTRPAGNTDSVSLSVTSLPAGVTATEATQPGTGNSGTINFTVQGAPAGTYQVTVNAAEQVSSTLSRVATANLTLVVAIVATVQNTVNTSVGLNGLLYEFMSTSFQPAEWDDNFFTLNPGATTTLNNLYPQHIRLQPVSAGTPQKDANTWDFSTLDAILDPVISVADKSPEFQIAVAPAFMRNADGTFVDPTYQQFAQYCANLVKYYNTSTGFTDAGGTTQVHSPTTVTPITWWGIFNEPNINQVDKNEYPKLYNAVVPAMQAAGSTVPLKFVAVELADFGSEPQNYLPPFVTNVTAQVDAVATHYYASCNQSDLDTALFGQITQTFVPHVKFIYSALKNNPALVNVPVWVTENNVNADFSNAQGNSTCNPSQKFVTDQRGTSAFFAAWRPYVFSQLGQAGNQALYHWDFDADQQYGEVDFDTGKTYLSCWVDGALEGTIGSGCPLPSVVGLVPDVIGVGCPVPHGGVPDYSILNVSVTETSTVEVLVAEADAGASNAEIRIMIANHAVHASTDNNGTGDPRTVLLDLSTFDFNAVGGSVPGFQRTIDASTDPSAGPTSVSVTVTPRMSITLNGYGVTFLTFGKPSGGPLPAIN